MTPTRAVAWTPLDPTAHPPVRVGDMVSADAGGLPIYRVMAWEEGRAWVAASPGAPARVMPLDRFRWRGTDS